MTLHPVPVIAIDGPTASGKGTVAQRVAERLGFHYLDSGALYRLTALAALQKGLALDDERALAEVACQLDIRFEAGKIWLAGQEGSEAIEVSEAIRTEAVSQSASRVAALPKVRQALLDRQRQFRQAPGLVCDGRDMGSVIFPDAVLKVFLTAALAVRAERRTNQLKEKGISAIMEDVVKELRTRDQRDSTRSSAPLRQEPDAHFLDTTQLSVDEAVQQIIRWYSEIGTHLPTFS